jgi:uncharacterized protein YbbK (DUF523 family)
MRPVPPLEQIQALPDNAFTPERPLRLLVSACLLGTPCGVEGKPYGDYDWIVRLTRLPNVMPVSFCPEQFSFGTPRAMPDIHGGDGFDVLDGKARVLTDKGEDWTAGMLAAAQEMLKIARANQVDLAVLMDMSAACGSQVISDGCRMVPQAQRKYQRGAGVCSALLLRNGFKVVAQRDYRSLEHLYRKLDPGHAIKADARDHHESEWYVGYFKSGQKL